MKYLISILLLGLSFVNFSCAQKTIAPVSDNNIEAKPVTLSPSGMTFVNRSIDIGVVKKGEKREIEYTFTNTGVEDIQITQVSTCDCTEVLYHPSLPVKPGAKSAIKVRFDSNKKDDEEPVEIDVWLEREDPNTGMQMLERLEYTFKFSS